mgnify:CR=1 FL=1
MKDPEFKYECTSCHKGTNATFNRCQFCAGDLVETKTPFQVVAPAGTAYGPSPVGILDCPILDSAPYPDMTD